MGFAVLRFRLYDVETLIDRAIVYGSLTATLAVLYFGGVATTQAIVQELTGQEDLPQIAIVASTLVIAALFNPLRRRIQSFIDRRFYRTKYDAAKTLEAFPVKLRDETDLDDLNAELITVVRETVRPAHASLWLRRSDASRTRTREKAKIFAGLRDGGVRVSRRAVLFVSWAVLPVAAVLMLGWIYLSILNRAGDVPGAAGVVASALIDLVVLGLVALGLLVAYRRPGNPIGWIIAGAGVAGLAADFVESYAVYALITNPGSLPGGAVMAWLSNWIFIPVIFAAPAMLFLLFPDGKLLSRRWRPVLWIVILTTCAAMASAILIPVLDEAPFEGVANPLGVAPPRTLLATLSNLGWPGMAASLLVAASAMILRLRRSRGVERQQLKWIAAAAAVLPLASAAGVVGYYLGYELVAGLAATFSVFPIFLAAGYAVLRYRLYDIDVVINRTLVYGLLTASLALVYFGSVAGLQRLLAPVAGQDSQLAIVASTLAIAALFNPLRRRIQSLIDRSFYRNKYDAARTLEEFGSRLRRETDLESLSDELVAVIRQTMQPAHASLWLRSPERRPREVEE